MKPHEYEKIEYKNIVAVADIRQSVGFIRLAFRNSKIGFLGLDFHFSSAVFGR